MVKLLDLVNPKSLVCETEEKQLPEDFKIRDRGLEFLKGRIELLNKKAAKYKVPPLTIKILKEEMVKDIHPDIKKMQMSQPMVMALDKGLLDDPNTWVLVKEYTVEIEGNPPQIEGYEFIARLEHTGAGNFIYTNPKSSVPNLPADFKTLNQRCDFCKTLRDRNDTFVVKMEQDDPKRFPEKKAGDLLVIGRNCLQAFMPGISISSIIAFTRLVESVREDVAAAQELEEKGEMGGGGGGKYYEDPEHLLRFLAATYLHTGFYISKKAAQANDEAGKTVGTTSTLSRALGEMRPSPWSKKPHEDYPIYYRLKEDPEFEGKVQKLCDDFSEWVKTKDFDALIALKPEMTDFFHNLKLVAAQDYIRGNHFGFYAALFQLFIRDRNDAEKKAEFAKQNAALDALPTSPVKFGEPALEKKRLKDIAKEAEIKRLTASGLDEKAIKKSIRGKEWGWEVECKKITEYERTNTFGSQDSSIGYRIFFRDAYGNDFLWFAGNNPGFVEGNKYIIDGAIVGYEVPNAQNQKYVHRPQSRINRVRILKDLANPTAPPQPEQPAEPPAQPPMV
jgi:hypothetical protein